MTVRTETEEDESNVSGVYGIFDSSTEECLYVGQSSCISTRKSQHLKNLRNRSRNALDDFVKWFHEEDREIQFVVLERTEDTDLAKNEAEIKWFYILQPKFYGKAPSSKDRWKHTPETKERIRAGVSKGYTSLLCVVCSKSFRGISAEVCSSQCRYRRSKGLGTEVPHNKVDLIDAKLLKDLYINKRMSARAVAKEMNISEPTVRKALRANEIEVRAREVQAKMYWDLHYDKIR